MVPHITNAVQDWCQRVACVPVDDTKEEPGMLLESEDSRPSRSLAIARVTMYLGLIGLVRSDVCIIELGGTVGDIESAPFIESMRQLRMRAGSKENFVSGLMYSVVIIAKRFKVAHTCYIHPSDPWRAKDQTHATGDSRRTECRLIP